MLERNGRASLGFVLLLWKLSTVLGFFHGIFFSSKAFICYWYDIPINISIIAWPSFIASVQD